MNRSAKIDDLARSTIAVAVLLAVLALSVSQSRAQVAQPPAGGPTQALAEALSAACREDHAAFVTHLTEENAAAFRALPEPQQTKLLKRLVLLDDPGRPLLSNTNQGRTELRCEAAGVIADMHLQPADIKENLAFITAEIGQLGDEPRSVRIGMVREGGDWKLLSVGLLLLDLPALSKEWQEEDLQASEGDAINAIAKIAQALDKYQEVYGKLPETLGQLGPAPDDGASIDHAALLSGELASGSSGAYSFRYVINPVAVPGDDSDLDKAAGFAVAATPIEYGKGGRRSFYLDSNGTLRGADKHGTVATVSDPEIALPQ